MLTTSRCEQAILHALGQTALPPETSAKEIVDRAGRWLASYPWSWLERHGTVATVIGQEWVSLAPLTGLRKVVSAQYVSGTTSWLVGADMGKIIEWRSYASGPPPNPSHYAVIDSLSTAGVFTTRLELWPTPSAVNTIRLQYIVGFQLPLDGVDTSRIAVPEDWEMLFLEAVIAVAMGYEERDVAGPDQRLDQLRQSHLFQTLMRQDGMKQSNFGPVRGGAAAMQATYWPSMRWPATAQNP